MSIVAGVTVERLQNMIDGTPRILRLLPNTPAMVFEGAFALCSDNDLTEDELEAAKSILKIGYFYPMSISGTLHCFHIFLKIHHQP